MTKEPILLVDSHHGIYSLFLAYQSLSDDLKEQVNKQLDKKDIEILSQNIDLIYGKDIDFEDVYFSFDKLCNIEIVHENTIYHVEQYEDIWLVPMGYDMSDFC